MKKWTYRFKRGLASFLAVGMIAGGVSNATCLPVYAATAATAAAAYTNAELNAAVEKIYNGLKEQISDLVNGSDPHTLDIAKFVVGIDCKSEALKTAVEGKAPEILSRISKDCFSDLFWYDSSSEEIDKRSYRLNVDYKDAKANFKFVFAVKETYRSDPKEPESVSVQEIRETKAALEDPKLQTDEVRKTLYDGLKDAILKLVNGEIEQSTAAFTVSFYDIDTEAKARVLKEEAEKMIPEVLASLSKDCPSELFWYDQSSNAFNSASYEYVFKKTNSQSANFKLTLAVKKAYRDPSNQDSAKSINAEEIVASKEGIDSILGKYNQTKGMSDYEILCGFSDALCDNYSDADDSDRYAEAFQYFCERTFGTTPEAAVRCETVEGTVNNISGTWNIVRIGGKNYLVDMKNHASGRNGEFFLVGAEVLQDGSGAYVIGNHTKYTPKEVNYKPVPTSPVRYIPGQAKFHFVSQLQPTATVGDVLLVEVDGNEGVVEFESDKPEYVTIETKKTRPELKDKTALIYLNDKGATGSVSVVIRAIAGATDAYEETTIEYKLSILPKNTGNNNQPPAENPGGGNTGGSGSGGDIGGGGGAIGGGSSVGSGSIGNGGVGTTATTALGLELIAQTDFTFDVGYAKILKAVGATDFTITAGGQVAGSKVTYKSSDTSVATVDANTGAVHIVGPGNAKIIATASATDIHKEATCEYKLEVVKEEGNIYN